MPRPANRFRALLTPSRIRLLVALGALGLLSACAQRPQITAEQEASDYKNHARHSYAAPGPAGDPWRPYIKEASERFDVPERWIREVMHQESGGKALAESGPGAMGLMQVMPGTYDELRGRYSDLGFDPFDPHDNILAGAAYIRELYDIYGSPGFLAAYNAGPGRLDDYLTRGRTLPTETRRYVAAIGPRIAGYDPNRTSPGAAYAMNALPLDIPAGPRYAPDPRYSGAPVQTASAAAVGQALQPIVLGQPTADQLMRDAAPSGQLASVAVAANEPVVRPIVLGQPTAAQLPAPARAAAPVEVAAMPEPVMRPITLGQPTPQPERFAAVVTPAPRQVATAAASLPIPPVPTAPTPAQQFAAFAPRSVPSAGAPVAQFASYAQPAGARSGGFHLVAPAMAEPIGRRPAPANDRGNWAIQVGAFANDRLAAAANVQARDASRELSGTSATVSGVRQGSATLYRARLHGLSHEGAQQACERLVRQHMDCILVSPDAQS